MVRHKAIKALLDKTVFIILYLDDLEADIDSRIEMFFAGYSVNHIRFEIGCQRTGRQTLELR